MKCLITNRLSRSQIYHNLFLSVYVERGGGFYYIAREVLLENWINQPEEKRDQGIKRFVPRNNRETIYHTQKYAYSHITNKLFTEQLLNQE